MILYRLKSPINRVGRSELNENFNRIEKSYKNIIDDSATSKQLSQESIDKANEALEKANQADIKADATSIQLETLIIESGTSDAELIASRTDSELGQTFTSLPNRLDTQYKNVNDQITQTRDEIGENPSNQTIWKELEEREYNVKWGGAIGSSDDTSTITTAFDYAKANGISEIIFPKSTYLINNLIFENFNDIVIDFRGSTLKGVDGVEGILTTFRNNTNLELKNFKMDGNNTFYRGLRIMANNTGLKINDFSINNISPIIRTGPTNIDSVGIELDLNNNHNINIERFSIDNVTNNDNGSIGDSLGSSRGILLRAITTYVESTDLKFKNFIITNIKSEDGDAIQCIGSSANSTFIDANFEDFTIDNSSRRALKLQFCHGVSFDKFKIKHTEKNIFNMSAGISVLSSGNNFSNFEMDIRAIKGFEFTPFEYSEKLTLVKNAKITMDNVATIAGSVVYAIDIVHSNFVTANNIEFNGIYVLSPDAGMIVRTYSRNVRVIDGNFNSYNKSENGVQFSPFTTDVLAQDGTNLLHANFEVNNIICDGRPFWGGDSATTIRRGIIKSLQSRDATINPYNTLVFKRTDVQSDRRVFYSAAYPNSGTFLDGDVMYNSTPTEGGFIGWVCVTSGTPGVWRGFGQIEGGA